MIEKVSKFAVNNKKIFENLAAKDKRVINHVVIEPK